METLIAYAVMAAVGCLFAYRTARARAKAWRKAAQAAGLTDLVSSSFRRRLTGRFGSLHVRLERYKRNRDHETGDRVVIDGLGHGSGEFALRREGMGSAVRKALGGREIEVGDETFDDLAYVQGAPHVVRAILDAETRAVVVPLLGGLVALGEESRIGTGSGHSYALPPKGAVKARISVSDGTLRAELPGLDSPSDLSDAVRTLLAAAERLVVPPDIPARLIANARNDPVPAVRLANLLTLAREYPEHSGTHEALRAARWDTDEEVRLRAAMGLGEEGWEVLLAIASREDTEDSRAARAIDALGEGLTREQAEAILQRSLRGKRSASALAATRALGRIGGAEVVPALVAALDEKSEEIVAAAASALGSSGERTAEDALIGALHRASSDLGASIAEALGRVGSAAAVAPLRGLASRHPLDVGLRRAVRQAIAEIQSRLAGATPGQLTLAEGESGQLSLADEGAHGWLSLEGAASIERADGSPVEEEDAFSSAPESPPPPKREEE